MPHFDEISVKISVLGSYTLTVAPMGMKFAVEVGTLKEGNAVPSTLNFIPIGATCHSCGAKKHKNRPLSNTGAVNCLRPCVVHD